VRGRAVVAGTAIVVAAVVLIASGAASSGLDEFRSASSVPSGLTTAERVTRLQNNGRLAHWRVALEHGFEPSPWQGSGAGTYAALWAQHRPAEGSVLDAHSLYVEQLGELGIVGLLLVVAVLLAMLAGLARRAWTEGGAWAALFAAALAWAAHSAVDWDWEMPATTLWLFAAGGLALARPGQGPAIATRRRSLRRGVGRAAAVAAIALLAAVPLSVLRSQSAVFEAVDALRDGDCAAAVARARDAMDILPQRSEPGEVLAYCATRAGRHADALRAIDAAIERDPREWTAAYGRALVLAAGGRDPRSAARRALRLNPNSRLTRNAVELFATGGRRAWRQRALQAPLALPPSPVELRRQIGR
jgi:tetratricopeptide (TPR) repeat protein